MVWAVSTVVALGSAAVGAYGAYSASKASGRAADAQEHASDQANQTQMAQYNQTREDQAPWRNAGASALGQLSAGIAPGGQFTQKFGDTNFQGDPGYQFRMQQGMDALNNQASARGGFLSGAQLKGAQEYGQGFASNEYGNAYNRFMNDQNTQFNRLSGVAGTGQVANGQVAQAGMNMANNVSQNQIGAGNARASGYIGSANAITGGISQGINAYQNGQFLNQLQKNYDANNTAFNPMFGGSMRGQNLDVNGQGIGLTGNPGGSNSLGSYGLAGGY